MNKPLVDHGKAQLVPFADLVEELLDLVLEDANELGCEREVLRIREIVSSGNSADRQRRAFSNVRDAGASVPDALRTVCRQLSDEFLQGL